MPANLGFLRTCLRALVGNRLAGAGALIIVTFALLCLAAPTLTRWHVLRAPGQQDEKGLDEDGLPRPAGGAYLLGTDSLGRDVLSRVVYGARVSLSVGIAAMLTATVIGVAVGLLAGFYGGKTDLLLMRFTEMNMTIPAVLLAIAFAGLLDVSGRTLHLHPAGLPWHFLDIPLKRGAVSVFLIIGLVCWPGLVRVVRAQVLALKEREFVQAARSIGASDARILLRTILPNLLPTVIVLAVMSTANTILLEAGLGYLGIGVPPPAPTWGSMISEGQPYFMTYPHLVIVPGLAIVLTVLAFNLLGQGLQEMVDPKQRR
jgi:ABC-type dipeptide/oligopeptide/nickel transport system permease subunit